jgi:hypothetical protein
MVDQKIPYKGDTKSFVPWYQWLASWHCNFGFNYVNIQGHLEILNFEVQNIRTENIYLGL